MQNRTQINTTSLQKQIFTRIKARSDCQVAGTEQKTTALGSKTLLGTWKTDKQKEDEMTTYHNKEVIILVDKSDPTNIEKYTLTEHAEGFLTLKETSPDGSPSIAFDPGAAILIGERLIRLGNLMRSGKAE